ncbi:MAG: glycosyltransferase family 1 protein, partial [Moorea sp. SIO3C2]|nr:glycosyltransferase family 1 protein [Moorena sp. SIO3C2]
MKILFVGDLSKHARSRQRFITMQNLGHSVDGLPSEPVKNQPMPNYKAKLSQRIRHKIGYPVDLIGLNQKLLVAITNYKPNLLWIEKANTIWPNTYREIKSNFPNLKIVYYSEDDIYVRNNRTVYLTKSLPIFDIVYTTKPRNLNELPNLGVKKVVCTYKGYEPNFHRPLD